MAELTPEQRKALAMAAARKRQQDAQGQPAFSGTILPFSRGQDGSVQFDSNAGAIGVLKRVMEGAGQFTRGERQVIDPETGHVSDDAIRWGLEGAMVASPMNPAVRAGDMAIPGVKMAPRKMPAAPAMSELKATSKAGFDAINDMDVQYAPKAIQNLAVLIHHELAKEGFTPRTAKQTYGELARLAKIPRTGAAGERVTMPLPNLNSARSVFGNIAKGRTGTPDEAAAEIVKRRISEFIESPVPGSVISGDAAKGAKVAKEARGNWAAAKRSAEIEGIDVRTARQAAGANSGLNAGNNIRQRLGQFLNNEKATRGFSKEELDAVEAIVNGTAAMNNTRFVSNLLGGGGGAGMTLTSALGGGGAALSGLGPAGTLAGATIPPAIGLGLRVQYNNLVKKALRSLDESVRMRSPLYEEVLRQTPAMPTGMVGRTAPTRGLLATGAGAANSRSGGGGY